MTNGSINGSLIGMISIPMMRIWRLLPLPTTLCHDGRRDVGRGTWVRRRIHSSRVRRTTSRVPNQRLRRWPSTGVGDDDAGQDRRAAEDEPDGDCLAEQQPGREDAEEWDEVDVDGHLARLETAQTAIPEDVADEDRQDA